MAPKPDGFSAIRCGDVHVDSPRVDESAVGVPLALTRRAADFSYITTMSSESMADEMAKDSPARYRGTTRVPAYL